MKPAQSKAPFLVRYPWMLVVLAFLLLLGSWTMLIIVAVKSSPQRIEWKKP